ncbi:calcium-binding protein [Sphingosinicella sp. BN140058]|uniref:calcium-binding protein n=1 Tax=Sphingosinicella sp. BN140058 TaxID=1892855 RepID=UPI0013EAA522|nr:calcium-binding protein [Sphingosinicella sp. BN140058]
MGKAGRHIYNTNVNGQIYGTKGADTFYPFESAPSAISADAFYASMTWTTGIKLAAGSGYLQVIGTNMNVSLDVLRGDGGHDHLYGSEGNDFLAYNNASVADGVGGFNSIYSFYLGGGDDIIDLSAHGSGGFSYKESVVLGGSGNDQIIGSGALNDLRGDDGNDYIVGAGGKDLIYGGSGNDTLYGDDLGAGESTGADEVFGEQGDDVIYGGKGNDLLMGESGADYIFGGLGEDEIWGGMDADILLGGESNDRVYGDTEADTIDGGAGDDSLYGGDQNDVITGGWGNDFLRGDRDHDILFGEGGSDTLFGDRGNDRLYGGPDSDVLFGGSGADQFVFKGPEMASGSDTVLDFEPGVDRIRLEKSGVTRFDPNGGNGSVMAVDDADGGVYLFVTNADGAVSSIHLLRPSWNSSIQASDLSTSDFIFL